MFSVLVEETSIEMNEPTMPSTSMTTPIQETKTESILMDLLTSTTKTSTPMETLPKCIPNKSSSQECMDNHTFYIVIIIGLVISNCILSCMSIQKR